MASRRSPPPQRAQPPQSDSATTEAWHVALKRELNAPQEGARVAALQGLNDRLRCVDDDPLRGDLVVATFLLEAWVGAEVLALARDDSVAVRAKALAALRYFPAFPEALPTLIRALADPDSGCREAATHSLKTLKPAHRHGHGTEEAWRAAVNHEDVRTRQAALQLLGHPPPERAAYVIGLARSAMRDGATEVRKAAIGLLRHINRDSASVAVSSLVTALAAEEAEVRREAIETLEWFGPDAVAAVQKLVEVMTGDSVETVRHAAVRAVLKIDPPCSLAFPSLATYEGESTREAIVQLLTTTAEAGRPLRRRLQEHWARQAGGQAKSDLSSFAGNPSAHTQAGHTDGPEEPSKFWWDGRSYHVPPIPFRLLLYMWPKDLAKTGDVEDYVWPGEEIKDSTLKSALHDLNSIFKQAGYPWMYGMQSSGGFIGKKKRSPKSC
jgi:HEAT repeat protein